MSVAPDRPVLFFDGDCNLCNGIVQFIIRHDKEGKFLFATLQSAAGEAVRSRLRQNAGVSQDSVILQYRGALYIKSAAVLKTAALMGGWWSVLKVGYLLPAGIRDSVYAFVSRNRYRWFGKRHTCMVPTPELERRFLN